MSRILSVSELDGLPLSRAPGRKASRKTPKFQSSVILPADAGRALREVARASDRSLSDVITDACLYWLDINVPEWRDAAAAAAAAMAVQGDHDQEGR